MQEMEQLKNDESAFVKIGAELYTLTKICTNGNNFIQDITDFHAMRAQEVIDSMSEGVAHDASNEHNAQIDRLRTRRRSVETRLEQSECNRPIIFDSQRGRAFTVKPFVYAPRTVSTSLRNLADHFGLLDEEGDFSVDDVCEYINLGDTDDYNYDDKLLVTFACNKVFPGIASFDLVANMIYTPGLVTFHTVSYSELCTGHHDARKFNELGARELSLQISAINLFSIGSWSIQTNGLTVLRLEDFLKLPVTNVARGDTWST